MVKASTEMHGTTFVDCGIYHQRTTLWKLYSVTLTYFSRSNILNASILEKVSAGSKLHHMAFMDSDIYHGLVPIPKVVLCDVDILFQG